MPKAFSSKLHSNPLLLGVNIDHVATLRQARGGMSPCVIEAAREAEKGGADSITVHLREDRRHIQDADVVKLKKTCRVPLNLEMALSDEIIRIALKTAPEKVCIVPERRLEITTEGGLDAVRYAAKLRRVIPLFRKKKIEVSLFINATAAQIKAAWDTGADAVEFHTGEYADAAASRQKKELRVITGAALFAHGLGLKVNAGHGLNYQNVGPIARIPFMRELNIGHAIVSRAVFFGLRESVRLMKKKMMSGS